MARRLPYQEGDWFAVPLVEGLWAAGRVARSHPGGKIVLAYLFGPFECQPALKELRGLRPEEAVLVGRLSDLGLVRREWPVLGRGDWQRDDWPLVPFRNVDSIMGHTRRVEFGDGSLTMPVVWCVVHDEMAGSPEDALFGHVALQYQLTKLFAVQDRSDLPSSEPGHLRE